MAAVRQVNNVKCTTQPSAADEMVKVTAAHEYRKLSASDFRRRIAASHVLRRRRVGPHRTTTPRDIPLTSPRLRCSLSSALPALPALSQRRCLLWCVVSRARTDLRAEVSPTRPRWISLVQQELFALRQARRRLRSCLCCWWHCACACLLSWYVHQLLFSCSVDGNAPINLAQSPRCRARSTSQSICGS